MQDHPFVGRQQQLGQLEGFLAKTLAGQGQICFVAGEAGSGKTTLVGEFTRRAQADHPELMVAIGDCNAQAGVGDAYLPFREVLQLLTGDLDSKLAQGKITPENASRLNKVVNKSAPIVLAVAWELAGLFIPGGKILAVLGKTMAKESGLDAKLAELAKRGPGHESLSQTPLNQDLIFEQYTNFLRKLAAQQPLLIVLDDLQWADESSLSLLFHIGRRLEGVPLFIVGCYRPDEVALGRPGTVAAGGGQDAERHPLDKIQSELKRYFGDIVLELGEEGAPEAGAFVDAYLDAEPNRLGAAFRRTLSEHTGGNPLFVVELLRDMQERGDLLKDPGGAWVERPGLDWSKLPARAEGVIEERINRLEEQLRRALTTASVEGEAFVAEVVARLEKLEERDLVRRLSGELSKQYRLVYATGVVRTAAARLSLYRFRQKLIQQYLYGRLDEAERSYLHEDVGNLLEELYADRLDEVAVELAWHFAEAGVSPKAVKYLRRAGELAAARYANAEAIQHFSRALQFLPADDQATRRAILLAREAIFNWQGKRAEQAADLKALAALATGPDGPAWRAEVTLRQANYARLTGDYEAALALVEQAVAQAGESKDSLAEARGYSLWGRTLLQRGAYGEAREWLRLGQELAEAGNQRDLLAVIAYDLALSEFYQDCFAEARPYLERAQALYEELQDKRGTINCLLLFGNLENRLGNLVAACDRWEEALNSCRALGWRFGEASLLSNLASNFLDIGGYETAQKLHEEALAICREIGDREGEAVSLDTLGLIRQRLNDPRAALPLFEGALAIDRAIGYRRGEGFVLTHLGHALADVGDLGAAADAFNAALGIRRALDEHSDVAIDDLAGLARVALAGGDRAGALALVKEILAWLAANGTGGIDEPALVYLICYEVLKSAGQAEEAEKVLAQGHALVEAGAERIQDTSLRALYLSSVPFNRELQAAWAAR